MTSSKFVQFPLLRQSKRWIATTEIHKVDSSVQLMRRRLKNAEAKPGEIGVAVFLDQNLNTLMAEPEGNLL